MHPPEDYFDFLWSLGWQISLDNHPGYNGGLSSDTSPNAPYFASYCVEVRPVNNVLSSQQ